MKHFSLFIFLFSFLFAACSKSDLALLQENEDVTTFTLAIEQEATSAVAKAATRATITPARYIMEVWSENGETPENVFDGGTKNQSAITSGSAFTVTLDKTKAYTCLFWADDNAAFDATELKSVALNTGKEATEAYFAKVNVPKGRNLDFAVTLKRAVAKIVLAETEAVQTADNLALSFSNIYPQFNVLEGGASGTAAQWTKTIKPAATTGDIATLYFFAKAEEQLTELAFTYVTETEKTVSNIPYQQNFATRIKGAYSSLAAFTFTVTADDDWNNPDNEVEFPQLPANTMSLTIDTRKNTANTSDATFILPLKGAFTGYDLTVDWGDGTSNTFASGITLDENNMLHTYTAGAGEYTITITSTQLDPAQQQMPKLAFGQNYSYTNINLAKLISLDSPLLNMGTDFSSCFRGCTGLTGAIPADLFEKNILATNFSRCFFVCTGLTGAIPANLFAANTAATNFSYCFSGCTKLTEIPATLFEKNTAATDFSYCFYVCTKLVLNADIFCDEATEKNTRFANKKMDFDYCFYNCGSDASVATGQGGTAPALWSYTMETSSTKTDCFSGVTKVTNVGDISTEWK